jgi:hypothetical protein
MSLKLSTKYAIIGVLILLLGIFFSGLYIGHKRGVNASTPTITALQQEIQHQIVIINNQKLYVSSIEQEIETLKKAKADGDVTNAELKKLNLYHVSELTRLTLMIDTLLNNVDNNGQVVKVIYDTIKVPRPAILLPFSFNKKDEYLDLKGNFNTLGKLDISLKMEAKLDVWSGWDKKSKQPTTKITTNNPYLSPLSINSIKMDVQKPKKIGVGFQCGYGITNSLKPSPYVGLGIQYSIFRF